MPVRRCPISTDINSPQSGNTQINEQVNNLLVQGFQAAKEGQRPQAYDLFCEVVKLDPSNEYGWLYRAATTDDMAEAYVCLQRVLSLNPNNQKAQRGVERIRARMAGEETESPSEQPNHNTNNGAAVAAQPEHNGYTQTQSYNPPINDAGIVSGLNAENQGFSPTVVESHQFNDHQQPENNYNDAQASGYPYPTQGNTPQNETNNFSNGSTNYTPAEATSYSQPEIQPEYEQNRFYQPLPIEESQPRYYQPVEEPRYQPRSNEIGALQPQEYHPDTNQNQNSNYPSDNYQTRDYPVENGEPASSQVPPPESQTLLDFLNRPIDDNGPIDNPKTDQASRRSNFRVGAVGTGVGAAQTRADRPKRSRGLGRREEAPLIATFGTETPTDLDEVGKTRSEKLQRRAAIILLVLAILVFLVAAIVYLQRNNNNTNQQQAANPTAEVVPPPSTPDQGTIVTDANGTPIGTAGVNTTAGNGVIGGANTTDTATQAVGTPAPVTTVAGANGGNTNGSNTDTANTTSSGSTTSAINPTTSSSSTTTSNNTQASQTTVAPSTTSAQTTTASATTKPATTNVAPSGLLKPVLYTVASGDNLTNLAKKFGTTIPAIVAANKGSYDLSPTGANLFAGNKIIIPVSRPNFTGKGGIITKAGDTLDSIANQNKITKEDLMKFNGLANDSDFKPGDALLLP